MPTRNCSAGDTRSESGDTYRTTAVRRLDEPLRVAVVTPLSDSRDAGLYVAASRINDETRLFLPRPALGTWPEDVSLTPVSSTGSRLTSMWMHGLRRLVGEFHADVVHVHTEPWSLIAQQLIGLDTAVVIHAVESRYRDAPWRLRVRRTGTRRVLTRASGYLNWGHTGLRAAAEAGLPARTPRGVISGSPPDPSVFTRIPMPAYTGEVHVTFVGRLVPEKGLDTLLAAIATPGLRGKTRLTVAGTGPESQALETLSRNLQVNAQFVGGLDAPALHEVLGHSHVLVVPSRDIPVWSEQWGRVAVEAMMTGRPVITSDAGELPGLVGPGQITFPQNDHRALAERIQVLHNNPVRLQEMADDAYRRSWSHRPDVLAVRLHDFWHEARRFYDEGQRATDGI